MRSPASSASWPPTSPPISPGRSGPSTAAWTCEGKVMNDLTDVVVLSATRTAIGRYGGGLAGVPPCALAATGVRQAGAGAGVEPPPRGPAVSVPAVHTGTRDMYPTRAAPAHPGPPAPT